MSAPLGELHARVNRAASAERFFLVEGAMRAGKTYACLAILRLSLESDPGSGAFMSRWVESDLWNKLVPDYRRVCDLLRLPIGAWDAKEQRFVFENGSYLHTMAWRSSEKAAMYAKPRGLTVAKGYVSQLEETPMDVAREWMMRLSQPGHRQWFLADANPVHDGHWIAKEWPVENTKPTHFYISTSMWDNAHNLDRGTIEAAESLYPLGHPMRRAKLEGLRGANSEGDPVYDGYFRPETHIDEHLEAWPWAPILAGWDFGAKHPAVVFWQVLPWGAIHGLGCIMGQNVMLEWFAPEVLRIAASWFPEHVDATGRLQVLHCGDPAGAAMTSHGLAMNAVRTLSGLGVALATKADSNDLRVRFACIQTLGGYMLRSTQPFDGDAPTDLAPSGPPRPSFAVSRRGLLLSRERGVSVEQPIDILAQAFSGGYVWDDEWTPHGALANIRRPLKDGFFEHCMNATEYVAHHFAHARPTQQVTAQQLARVQAKAAVEEKLKQRREQRDKDPADARVGLESHRMWVSPVVASMRRRSGY